MRPAAAPHAPQTAAASVPLTCVRQPLCRWIILIVFSAIFRWAMAEPQLPSFEPEDDKGWHLIYRQTSPFVWPKNKLDLCKFDHVTPRRDSNPGAMLCARKCVF